MFLLVATLALQSADSIVFRVSPESRFEVKTGKAGLLGFAGHDHVIRAHGFTGRVVYRPSAPSTSTVEIVVPTERLEVLTPPDTEEIRKVTQDMRTKVLEVDRYPEIRLVSRSMELNGDRLHLVAALTMHGVTRDVLLEVHIAMTSDTLRGTTTFSVKQSDFGIRRASGGPAGTVRVADRVTFDITAVAIRAES
jgi:polyisoprenoid-binding protein YceI